MPEIHFGAFAPQGWKTELAAIPDARDKWRVCRDTARLAEQLGYDSIWVYDHFHNVPRPAHESVFECWTTMAALAEATTRIRLGQMVSCTSYRSPALTAKPTAGSSGASAPAGTSTSTTRTGTRSPPRRNGSSSSGRRSRSSP